MSNHPLKKILYVEDDPDIQAVARLALERMGGFTVELCSSGQEAIERAPLFEPDLVLLDVMMPGMDGPSTHELLKKNPRTARIPVIYLTAKAQLHEIANYKERGALDVITKPFDPMTLCDQIKKIWQKLPYSRFVQ